ncbi:hypothetical protein MK489_12505 [Myxococcota bacterium]|nr:hypothetical protein [Myxococcota bacterium]
MSGLVETMGSHPTARLGLDLGDEEDVGRWLIANSLLGGRIATQTSLRAFLSLREHGLERPATLLQTGASRVASVLRSVDFPRHEQAARQVIRLAEGLSKAGGSLEALASNAVDLQELGPRLTNLAPGFGVGGVTRFLRPLRETWAQAMELPLHPAARAAAIHLGFIGESEDLEGEPGALRAAIRKEPDDLSFADLEWGLERLGGLSCARDQPERCPLSGHCPHLLSPGS